MQSKRTPKPIAEVFTGGKGHGRNYRPKFLIMGLFPTFAGSKPKHKHEQLRDGIHFKSRFV